MEKPNKDKSPKGSTLSGLTAPTDDVFPLATSFQFSANEGALEANALLLSSHSFDFDKVLQKEEGSTAWHGSEFQPVEQLEQFLDAHRQWDYMFKRELLEEDRATELLA